MKMLTVNERGKTILKSRIDFQMIQKHKHYQSNIRVLLENN